MTNNRNRVSKEQIVVKRVQTGVRLEQRLLKVMKALAEYHEVSLAELIEGIVLHAFDGKSPFDQESLNKITQLKSVYQLELNSRDSHRLTEAMDELKKEGNDD